VEVVSEAQKRSKLQRFREHGRWVDKPEELARIEACILDPTKHEITGTLVAVLDDGHEIPERGFSFRASRRGISAIWYRYRRPQSHKDPEELGRSSGCGRGVFTAASCGNRAGHPARTSPDRWTARSSPGPPGRPIAQTPVRRDHRYIERTQTNRRNRHVSTTPTQTRTQTTLIATMRNWLRQLRGGHDAMFRYDREFQA
jgi:hypothetical protein